MSITPLDLLDHKRLNELRSLDDEEAFLNDLIELFRSETAVSLDELKVAVENAQVDAARSVAHRIKGASASLGAKHMAIVASSIETADSGETMRSLFPELSRSYEMTISELTNS